MEDLIDSKRKTVEKMLATKGDGITDSLTSIILDSFPSILWTELPADEVCLALNRCIEFILSPPSLSATKDEREFVPRVCVYNPTQESEEARSFSRDITVVGVHVVNRPFIYESLRNYFIKAGNRLIGAAHPIFFTLRKDGKIISLSPEGEGEGELFINLYIDKVDEGSLKEIRDDLLAILSCISCSVNDFEPMKERVRGCAKMVHKLVVPGSRFKGSELSEFLDWLASDNFVLLGIREYKITSLDANPGLAVVEGEELGVFREKGLIDRIIPGFIPEVEEIILTRAAQPRFLSSDFCSTGGKVLYQLSPMEFFSIRHEREKNGDRRETVLIGRLTRGATHWRSDAIPMLRYKSESITEVFSRGADYFRYREARAIFNFLPKQEVFYANVDQLNDLISNIMSAQSDEDVTVHLRMGDGGRYAMVMVTIASNDNSYPVRTAIESYLSLKLNRDITVWHHSDTEARTLLFYYFCTPGDEFISFDFSKAKEDIKEIAAGWEQQFSKALHAIFDNLAPSMYKLYINSMGKVYRGANSPEIAAAEVQRIENLFDEGRMQVGFSLFASSMAEISLYSKHPLPLMPILKELENFGLYVTGERAYKLEDIGDKGDAFIYNYILEDSPEKLEKFESLIPVFVDAILALKEGRLENDSLNRLLILEGMERRSIELVRTLKNYLLQINRAYSDSALNETMIRHSSIVSDIYGYFSAKFSASPRSKRDKAALMKEYEEKIARGLSDIPGLADFQIINTLFNIARNTTRTNFYLKTEKKYISIKIESCRIQEVPLPRPMVEIYVHAPTFEGVHLRGGAVSRGGIRWSDRPGDFRTEVLGLMKTQMLKNSIIVPQGAKGGFIIKKSLFGSREEQYEYMKDQYRSFISALLDITDNYAGGKELHPKGVISYDGFDPYLVVAADKGTALLSDRANEISKSYDFWLGDAFASGGKSGYDHKRIGITARGAWESVKRHFRELDIDVQKEPFTVAGIGDMSGDVFGNGMLLSDRIKLVAAFNHMHIFLDPDPDPETSFMERQRLFKLSASSWTDYKSELISRGGGVFLRSAKSIPVSDEMSVYLAAGRKEVTGEEMVRLILKSKVDLLYNGGIGTYIKAKSESDLDVGDKTNDRVRVNGCEVRAMVIGEGGNLGLTQRGRLEYSEAGGRCYTDALDNSGGVNISDHEVNLKIMLNHLIEKGEIAGIEKRDAILEEMTEKIAEKVLKNNYLQSAACSMDYIRARSAPDTFVRVVDEMERSISFSRTEESVPASQEMKEALQKGAEPFTRPLIAVLMGYQKMKYFDELLRSDLVDTFFAQTYLRDYFPGRIRDDFAPFLGEHRLKAEIISTMIVNRIINRAGITLFPMISSYTEQPVPEIAKGYIIIENLLNADSFREELYSLDNVISSRLQYRYLMAMEDALAHALKWFIKHQSDGRMSFDFIGQYMQSVSSFHDDLWDSIREICGREKLDKLDSILERDLSEGMPEALVKRYLLLPFMKDIMDIIRIKETHHSSFNETASLYLKVSDYFNIDWIAEGVEKIQVADKWGLENLSHLRHELKDHQDGIVMSVINFKRKSENLLDAFEHYIQENSRKAEEYLQSVAELKAEGKLGIISVNVIVRKLSDFIHEVDYDRL